MNLPAGNFISIGYRGGRPLIAVLLLALFGGLTPAQAKDAGVTVPAQFSPFGRLPLSFEAGETETGRPINFIARGPAYRLLIGPTEARLSIRKFSRPQPSLPGPAGRKVTAITETGRDLHLEFVGGNASARLAGEDALSGSVNYFIGNDSARWRTGAPMFARVRVAELYPGISLIHYGNQQRLEYDFVVAPGADPSVITIKFTGADQVRLEETGELVLQLGVDEIRQPKPLVYQDIAGTRKEIDGHYVLTDAQTVKFSVAAYDHRHPLVIDPVLSYATYYGGGGLDAAWGVAVDTNGFVYVAGETMAGLPTSVGALTNLYGGAGTGLHGDAFVAKFDNRASKVIYLAYVGGALDDVALSLAVDDGGNAYITGYTDSTNFPLKSAIFGSISGAPYPALGVHPLDGFVTKLGPLGTNLIYSTYLGGDGVDEGVGITVDATGAAYVAGYTESTNFPVANAGGGFTNYGGHGDAFVTKFGPAGTNLVYSFYLGGTNLDVANDVAADALGRAYVTGYTTSTNFPTSTNAAQPWLAGGQNAFVTVVGAAGANLVSSTYFGGVGTNAGYRLALDGAANIYVTGTTVGDPSFPVTPSGINPGGVFSSTNAGAAWNAASVGLQSVTVFSLAGDPANAARVYAGTARGVARSDDGGVTWTTSLSVAAMNSNLAPAVAVGSVLSLALDPLDPSKLYAATKQGVFKSSDAGTNWSLSGLDLNGFSPRTLAIDPSNPTTIYAGGALGIFKSTNGAATWDAINPVNLSVRAVVVDPVTPATVYVASDSGVYRSLDGGGSWAAFNNGLASLSAQTLALDPVTPTTVYVGTAAGAFRSANRGTNWVIINTGLASSNVLALAIDPLAPATVYAGTTNGLYQTINAGISWSPITNGLAGLPILAVQSSSQFPNRLFAASGGASVIGGQDAFLTKIGSDGFSLVLGGSSNDQGWDVAVDPAGHAHLVGTTLSTDFPVRNPAGQLSATNAGLVDVFVAEISSDGNNLLNSAYFGGSGVDSGYGIAVDVAGNAYVVGQTGSANFPTRAALQNTYGGSQDAFLAKIGNSTFQPTLAIAASGQQVELSWPALASEFNLQSTLNLLSTNGWTTISAAPDPTNQLLKLTLPATNTSQFFRLANP